MCCKTYALPDLINSGWHWPMLDSPSTFSGSHSMPFFVTTSPKSLTDFWNHWHLEGQFEARICNLGRQRTFAIVDPTEPFPRVSETRALESPNGMTLNLKSPFRVTKAVFDLSSSLILICQKNSHWPYPSGRTSLHPKVFKVSSILGNG